jgi:hypothetical protein
MKFVIAYHCPQNNTYVYWRGSAAGWTRTRAAAHRYETLQMAKRGLAVIRRSTRYSRLGAQILEVED